MYELYRVYICKTNSHDLLCFDLINNNDLIIMKCVILFDFNVYIKLTCVSYISSINGKIDIKGKCLSVRLHLFLYIHISFKKYIW